MADKKTKTRKSSANGKKDGNLRSFALGATAGLGAIAALVVGFSAFARRTRGGEHAATDLAADAPPIGTERAPDAFRPDPTAPVPASEREALRPATGPGPSITSPRGEMANQTGAANG